MGLSRKMSTTTKDTGLSLVKRQTTIATQQASEVVIKTDDDYEKASTLLSKIKTVQAMVKKESGKILEPLRESKRQAQQAMDAENARWEPILEDAKSAEMMVKQKMVQYVDKKEFEARQKEVKIQQQLEDGEIDMEKASVKMDKIVQAPQSVAGSQVRKVRNVYVVDEALVPKKYWSLNMVQVRADALAGFEIPGVIVKEETSIAGSAR